MSFIDNISPEAPNGVKKPKPAENTLAIFTSFGRIYQLLGTFSKWLLRLFSVVFVISVLFLSLFPEMLTEEEVTTSRVIIAYGFLTYPFILPSILSWINGFRPIFYLLSLAYVSVILVAHYSVFFLSTDGSGMGGYFRSMPFLWRWFFGVYFVIFLFAVISKDRLKIWFSWFSKKRKGAG